jgi:hypothetical protein
MSPPAATSRISLPCGTFICMTSPVIDQSSQINGNANLDEETALVPHTKAVLSLNMASGALSKEKMRKNHRYHQCCGAGAGTAATVSFYHG